jgi:hypothetical protein
MPWLKRNFFAIALASVAVLVMLVLGFAPISWIAAAVLLVIGVTIDLNRAR